MLDYEEIKAQLSVTTVLSRYGYGPTHGRSKYRIPCPLHGGERDSFTVDEDLGRWFCFTCHRGGDVINLVAAFENCRNGEAAEKIVSGFNVHIRNDPFVREARKTIAKAQEWKLAHEAPPATAGLPETVELESYRGFSKEAIDHFGLRLIPGRGWGEGIFIPMKLENGETVGYSIRHWDDFLEYFKEYHGKRAPKYLNTDGLKKRGILFGLADNKDAIQKEGYAVLVEGQFDCISLWDRGVKNVAGVMGSALSPEQAQVLMRYTTKLILLFDGDDAGRKGAAQVTQRYGSVFNIRCLSLPEGLDPDSADLKELGVINVVV